MPLKTSFLFLVGIPNPNDDPPVTDVAYESSMSDDPRVHGDLGDSCPFRASPLPAPRSLSKNKLGMSCFATDKCFALKSE